MKKVLVVDDELDMRTFVTTLLETNGYKALSASDGEEGLEKTLKNRPSLIILDVMMPKMGGIKMYHELKKYPELNKIPVIMLSAISEKTFLHSYKLYSLQDGSRYCTPFSYIEKPPEPEELLNVIHDILKQL
jgi:CheY-like chemotaxis protein